MSGEYIVSIRLKVGKQSFKMVIQQISFL